MFNLADARPLKLHDHDAYLCSWLLPVSITFVGH